ncbi:MAG: hypothetical protein ACR2K3_14525 [Nocardioides sp.]
MNLQIRTSSVLRGVGAGLACLAPGVRGRATAVLASYGAAWAVDPVGIQFFAIAPDESADPFVRAATPFVTSAASWTGVQLLAASTIRRQGVPAPLAAVAYGALVAVADSAAADAFVRLRAKRAATSAEAAPAAE